MNVSAPVSLRVNPDIDAETHPYIATGLKENKFGIAFEDAIVAYAKAAKMDHIQIVGIDCHIGSQITGIAPFEDALDRLIMLINTLNSKGISLQHVDIGGGLGICYQDESPPTVSEYVTSVLAKFVNTQYELIIEPGRSILGNAGVLLTRVEYLKSTPNKNFAIIDAAMNDLLRPALYNAWHKILPLTQPIDKKGVVYDLVGPVCETSDIIARDRELNLREGDVLAVCSVGAYGFSMSSTYNSRPRPCEVLVDGKTVHEIRQRETVENLMMGESLYLDE